MPLLGVAKQRIADHIGSAATKGAGRQNILCAYLAGALLIGLAGSAIAGEARPRCGPRRFQSAMAAPTTAPTTERRRARGLAGASP
jgi:hypothetical protein